MRDTADISPYIVSGVKLITNAPGAGTNVHKVRFVSNVAIIYPRSLDQRLLAGIGEAADHLTNRLHKVSCGPNSDGASRQRRSL